MCRHSTNMHVGVPKQQLQCSRIGFSNDNKPLSRRMPNTFQACNDVSLQTCVTCLHASLLTASRKCCCQPGTHETMSCVASSAHETRCYKQGHPSMESGQARSRKRSKNPVLQNGLSTLFCADSSRENRRGQTRVLLRLYIYIY